MELKLWSTIVTVGDAINVFGDGEAKRLGTPGLGHKVHTKA